MIVAGVCVCVCARDVCVCAVSSHTVKNLNITYVEAGRFQLFVDFFFSV